MLKSQRSSPTSPEVISPVGLAVLPVISPLGPSPVDLDRSFDIPEAQHPLPESSPPSPLLVHEPFVEESTTMSRLKPTEEPCDSSMDLSSVQQENGTLSVKDERWDTRLKHSAPSSPRSFVTSIQELNDELSHEIEIGKYFFVFFPTLKILC